MNIQKPERIAAKDGIAGENEYIESHPAYGMVGLSRIQVSGNGLALHGSAVKHGTVIKLAIHTAEKRHTLSRDWHHARQKVVEVYLSGNQLADMLTCMNVGDGVPCTITYKDGPVPGLPSEDPREVMKKRGDARMQQLQQQVKELRAELDGLLNGGKFNKEVKERMKFLTLKIEQAVGANYDYMQDNLAEYTDDLLTEAKGEFSAMVDSMIHSRGLGALQLEAANKAIALPGDEEET